MLVDKDSEEPGWEEAGIAEDVGPAESEEGPGAAPAPEPSATESEPELQPEVLIHAGLSLLLCSLRVYALYRKERIDVWSALAADVTFDELTREAAGSMRALVHQVQLLRRRRV